MYKMYLEEVETIQKAILDGWKFKMVKGTREMKGVKAGKVVMFENSLKFSEWLKENKYTI